MSVLATDTKIPSVTYTIHVGGSANPSDKIKYVMETFKDGDAITWLRWARKFKRLVALKNWEKNAPALFGNLRMLLVGHALILFEQYLLEFNEGGETIDACMKTISSVGLEYLPDHPRSYIVEMLRSMRKPRAKSVAEHTSEMVELAELINHIPNNSHPLTQEDLAHLFVRSMPHPWICKWEESGQYASNVSEVRRYFTKVERMSDDSAKRDTHKQPRTRHDTPKQLEQSRNNNKKSSFTKREQKWCSLHKTKSHSDQECKTQKKSKAETNFIDVESTIGSEDECLHIFDPSNYTTMENTCIIQRQDNTLQALLDTGASVSVINHSIAGPNLRPCSKKLLTAIGSMQSSYEVDMAIIFPQFTKHRSIPWTFYAIKNLHKPIIIGRDILDKMEIIVDFKQKRLVWDELSISMSPNEAEIPTDTNIQNTVNTNDITEPDDEILQAIPSNLSSQQHSQASVMFSNFKTLFHGLGTMQGQPYVIPMKPNHKPAHTRPYLAAVKAEIQRLIEMDVIKPNTTSPWASPAFP
ncbi:unnamed protein product, partial [Aphanomyces euteiches]